MYGSGLLVFLAALGLHCGMWDVRRGLSLVVMLGVSRHSTTQASLAVACRLSCGTCGILVLQGLSWCPLNWKADS